MDQQKDVTRRHAGRQEDKQRVETRDKNKEKPSNPISSWRVKDDITGTKRTETDGPRKNVNTIRKKEKWQSNSYCITIR